MFLQLYIPNERMNEECKSQTLFSPLTFSPLSLETCLFSLMSHLLPKIIFSTSADACWEENTNMNTVVVGMVGIYVV